MDSRVNPALLGRLNVRRVLEVLHRHGPASRADVTRRAGVSAPTVSKAVDSLLRSGMVEEGEAPAASVGRPARARRYMPKRLFNEPGKSAVTAAGPFSAISGTQV